MIELNSTAALYESRARIALAQGRASLLGSLGAIPTAAAPAPLARRDYRPLAATVELRRPASESPYEASQAA